MWFFMCPEEDRYLEEEQINALKKRILFYGIFLKGGCATYAHVSSFWVICGAKKNNE